MQYTKIKRQTTSVVKGCYKLAVCVQLSPLKSPSQAPFATRGNDRTGARMWLIFGLVNTTTEHNLSFYFLVFFVSRCSCIVLFFAFELTPDIGWLSRGHRVGWGARKAPWPGGPLRSPQKPLFLSSFFMSFSIVKLVFILFVLHCMHTKGIIIKTDFQTEQSQHYRILLISEACCIDV